ncbi:MAG: poly-gamma-glutamate biosynthesis protein PgsC [Ignavibacteriales bacterium]|nr:poly-gamma-glutamate biosynthesis protein PgsC [Ignavibacteriales bacterium]
MTYEYFAIGLVIGFIFYEMTGISPGGVVTPAYFAMNIYRPVEILITVVFGIFVFIMIKMAASHLIIFGRRRLLLAILFGISVKLLFTGISVEFAQNIASINSIGYIIPGLIANESYRQKIIPTLSGITIVSGLTFLIAMIIF